MNEMATLTTALLDLSHALKDADLKLIVGGAFGIYLKYRELLKGPQDPSQQVAGTPLY